MPAACPFVYGWAVKIGLMAGRQVSCAVQREAWPLCADRPPLQIRRDRCWLRSWIVEAGADKGAVGGDHDGGLRGHRSRYGQPLGQALCVCELAMELGAARLPGAHGL